MCNIEITQQNLQDLLEIFEKRAFEAGLCEEGSTEQAITKKCEDLFKSDYSLMELDNFNGSLCPRYPSRIFIPESETNHSNGPSTSAAALSRFVSPGVNGLANGIQAFVTFANTTNNLPQQQNTIYEDLFDAGKIRELIAMAKYARCRQRFAVPVIMYKGKYICRSATISVMPEAYGRKVVNYAYDCLNGGASTSAASTSSNAPSTSSSGETSSSSSSSSSNSSSSSCSAMAISEEDNNDPTEESLLNNVTEPSPFSYEEVIKSDIQLLKALNVSTIIDLMVEQRKVKYFMTVSSSEKADPENHYEEFNILSMPYPGCEFFKKFRDNNYMAKNLFFNWRQSFIDASLSIPINAPANDIDINWQEYKEWDLVQITQNYLKATIKSIQEENSGVLIHCISGWDRTPLFVSLVRLSLWADGLIHQSLSPLQMTYLTVAYDWYLFGHQLPDRLRRSEDIMFFCFHVLKYITDEDFSAVEHRRRTKTTSSSGSSGVLVLRSDGGDDDAIKEDLNFEDSNDSNSNLSNCDMPITDNFYPASNNITSRSPNPKRSKTSPISVPEGNAARQRQESTSSIGSWQVVTDTGSLDSNTNSSYVGRQDAPNSASSSTTAKDAKVAITSRKQRLNAIRAIFITTYGKTIGLKFKEGSSMTLSSFIGTLADQFFT